MTVMRAARIRKAVSNMTQHAGEQHRLVNGIDFHEDELDERHEFMIGGT